MSRRWKHRAKKILLLVLVSGAFLGAWAVVAAVDPQESTQNGPYWVDLKSVNMGLSGSNLELEVCYYADFPNGGRHYLNGVFYWDVDRDPTTGSTPSTVTFDRPGVSPTSVGEPDEGAGHRRSEGSEYRLVWSLQTQTAGSGTLTGNSGLWAWSPSGWAQLSTSVSYAFVDSDGSGGADCLRFTFPESAIGAPSSPAGLLWSVAQVFDIQWGWIGGVTLKRGGDGITVDGEDDWGSVIPIATYTDGTDGTNPAEVDLDTVKVTNDDTYLYVYVKTYGSGITNIDAPGRQGYNQEQKWYRSQWIYFDVDGNGIYERKVYASWELNGNDEIIFSVKVLNVSWGLLKQYSYFGAYTGTGYDAVVAPSDPGDGTSCSPSSPCGAARLDTTATAADEGVLEFRVPLADLGLNPGDTITNFAVGDTFGEFQDYLPAAPGKTTWITPSKHAGKVVINEVLYRQTCSNGTDNDEFVELYVTEDINMCGWQIADGNVVGGDTDGIGTFTYTFNPTDGCTFHAGDYIVIWVGSNNSMTQAPHAALEVHLGKSVKLNNNGDDIWLFDADGEIVDYMAYGSDHAINDQGVLPIGFWNGDADLVGSSGQSLSLTPNGVDTSWGNDWEPTTSDAAPGPITRDTDDLTCSGSSRVSSVGVNNNGLDYGDAPASYGPTAHSPDPHLYLGTIVADPEAAPLYSSDATGDDVDSTDDEDGVSTFPPLDTTTTTYTLQVELHNGLSVNAYLAGWIDFDRNGTFDADEYASVSVPAGTTGSVSLTWTVPTDITPGDTFVRLRLSREPLNATDAATIDGIGEVEDYLLPIATPTPTPTPLPPTATPTPLPPTATATATPTTPTPTLLPPLDPPSGEKVGILQGWPIIRWRHVWINPNTEAMVVRIEDPIPAGSVFQDSLTCEARGTSITTRCEYDAGLNAVIWEGTLGPDAGHTTEDEALNEVVISFNVRVTDTTQEAFVNEARAVWDQNRNGQLDPGESSTFVRVQARVRRPQLPETGFPPNRVSVLPPMPQGYAYADFGSLWLEIPKLHVKAPIVGVPQQGENPWNVTWLWDRVGWLAGTAFPTWQGNTVLAAHSTLPTGLPGPFARLDELRWGDRLILHAFGYVYEYRVQRLTWVSPENLKPLAPSSEDVLTLITCAGWDETQDRYRYRIVVQAALSLWYRPISSEWGIP